MVGSACAARSYDRRLVVCMKPPARWSEGLGPGGRTTTIQTQGPSKRQAADKTNNHAEDHMLNWVAYARSAAASRSAIRDQLDRIEGALVEAGLMQPQEVLPRGHTPDEGVFVDDGQNGLKPLGERPAGAALLDYCASHPQPTLQPGLVVVTDWTRLGRHDPGLMMQVVGQLAAWGWVVRCAHGRP